MMIDPAKVKQFLTGLDYPVSKDELVDKAKEAGAGEDVINALQKLQKTSFDAPADVVREVGKTK